MEDSRFKKEEGRFKKGRGTRDKARGRNGSHHLFLTSSLLTFLAPLRELLLASSKREDRS